MDTFVKNAPFAENIYPTNYTEVGDLSMKDLDNNVYLQFISSEFHLPISMKEL